MTKKEMLSEAKDLMAEYVEQVAEEYDGLSPFERVCIETSFLSGAEWAWERRTKASKR